MIEAAATPQASKILYIDAPCGLAGDMLVSALTDVGVPERYLRQVASQLSLPGRLVWSRVRRGAIEACAFKVEEAEPQPERSFREICALLDAAGLSERIRTRARAVFTKLAQAEARVHGCAIEDVHFHEVGALDSIVDIVLACAGFDHLGASVVCSPLPLARGWAETRHGRVPLPAPATLLCLEGVPTYGVDARAELVTPTGASLIGVHATQYLQWPSMVPRAVGYGAGQRDDPDRPNVVRLVLGTVPSPAPSAVWLLETNVDDASAEIVSHAIISARDAGALDAWSTAVGMKKGRAGVMISALVRADDRDAVARAILTETSAIGLRMSPVERWERPRRQLLVATPYGDVGVKIADGDGLPPNVAPEYEACKLVAAASGQPLKTVYAAALSAALRIIGSSV